MGRHHLLFSVRVEHDFFLGGCRDLVFEPTPETRANVSSLGLLRRTTVDGVALFFDDSRADGLRLRAGEADPLWFAWRIRSRDRAFENYTQPSPRKFESKVLFFSNLPARDTRDPDEAGGGPMRLHAGRSVADVDFTDWDRVAQAPMPEGLGNPRDRRLPPHFVAAIRIGTGDPGPTLEAGQHYVIRFGARETVWKYYVLGLGSKGAPYVADADSQIEFVAGEDESLAGDRTARVFRSTTPITLQDRSEIKLQLRESSTGNGRILVRRLPVATAAQIYREVVDGNETFVSEIYVNC
jgi:hypothetical protein